MNLPKLLQLFNDIWKVKEPSTLVSADAGTVHPVQFATLTLASLPQFKRCWENALKHAEDAFRRSGQEADDEAKKEMALSVINDVIFLKLKTVFASVCIAPHVCSPVTSHRRNQRNEGSASQAEPRARCVPLLIPDRRCWLERRTACRTDHCRACAS